jgi:mevalonate kinase
VTDVRVSAPGKLFLLGEYAVLEGAPALVMAVDRRAGVTATASENWRLTASELGVSGLALGPYGELPDVALPDGTLPGGLDPGTRSRLRLVDEVRRRVEALPGVPSPPLDLAIDTSALHADGAKLGLGSSAAVAVALAMALASARGIALGGPELFALAHDAHHAAQGGSGSGGDVAASVFGGLLIFRTGASPTPAALPDGLALFAVATGTGSSTIDLVGRVASYREQDPAGARRDLDALAVLAERARTALEDADAFLALADDYFRALESLDAHARAGIVTERHRELRDLASASGAVFKTTGAGGGDLGIVFAKLESTDELESAFTQAGAAVIPVPASHDGARFDGTATA